MPKVDGGPVLWQMGVYEFMNTFYEHRAPAHVRQPRKIDSLRQNLIQTQENSISDCCATPRQPPAREHGVFVEKCGMCAWPSDEGKPMDNRDSFGRVRIWMVPYSASWPRRGKGYPPSSAMQQFVPITFQCFLNAHESRHKNVDLTRFNFLYGADIEIHQFSHLRGKVDRLGAPAHHEERYRQERKLPHLPPYLCDFAFGKRSRHPLHPTDFRTRQS